MANEIDVVAAASAMMSMARTISIESHTHRQKLGRKVRSPTTEPLSPPSKRVHRETALEDQAELLQQAALHVATLEQKNNALEDQVQQLQRQLQQQQPTVLRVVNTGVVQQLRSTVESLQAANANLQLDMTKLRTDHTGLAATYNMSRTANASLLVEIARLRQANTVTTAEKDLLVAEVAQLRTDKDKAAADNDALIAENKAITSSMVSLLAECNRLRADHGSQPRSEKQRRQYRAWTDDETMALINGVRVVYDPMQRTMDWTAVLNQSPILLQNGRIPLDLKDKWRNLEHTGVIPIPMPKYRM